MYLLKQEFEGPEVKDIPARVREELGKLDLDRKIRPGDTVAITAGSRGIRHIDIITKSVVNEMKKLEALPFIIPAMGSHGGGTAEGQMKVLAGYGITEESMGCEIRSSMETVVIGTSRLGTKVYLDRYASEADHIAVVNRVKPHTKLIGEVESGLMKMCIIGLGKRDGARTYHREIDRHSWMEVLESVADTVIEKSPIAFGLAVLQNAREEIGKLVALKPDEFYSAEKDLLKEAGGMMARLPFDDVDLLIVDEMGKDISGTGMDTNITGRKEGSAMKVVRVFVRDLTEHTGGNAQGIGLADFTTKRLVDRIDYDALYVNALTAYRTDSCKIPMYFETDRQVLATALDMAGAERPEEYKVAWIKNTLEIEKIAVSEAYLDRARGSDSLNIKGAYKPEFDDYGNLVSPFE